ncbi:MAG: amino acid ABC transporter permease [Planctomycetes bacterium]|nr:amino acid ABC transporter permease [Planctomycetota bacterium]
MAIIDFLLKDIFLLDLLKAAGYTLLLTGTAMPLAVALGLVLAGLRLSRRKWLAWPAATYIEVIRGTPLLVQLFLIYYALPQLGEYFNTDWLTWDKLYVGIFCLGANYAAYEAEILRAGLEAVDRGQREAALCIGMSERQAFQRVVLPQAFRIVVPPLINDVIAMLKDSSLVFVIGVQELLTVAMAIGRSRFTVPRMMVAAAVLYLVMSMACYFLGKYLERRLKVQARAELQQHHGH